MSEWSKYHHFILHYYWQLLVLHALTSLALVGSIIPNESKVNMVLLSLSSHDNISERTQGWQTPERTTTTTLRKGTIDAALDKEQKESRSVCFELPSIANDPFFQIPSIDNQHDNEEDNLEVVPCPIWVDGRLTQRRQEFQDTVQVWTFQDFEGLSEFMDLHKRGIEQRQASTLQVVHERFQSIVQTIVDSHGLYESVLGQRDFQESALPTEVALYASPNVRFKRGGYATFLHSDAVYSSGSGSAASCCSTRAMINVWLSLNQDPFGNYPLCFVKCPVKYTRPVDTKLYGRGKYFRRPVDDNTDNDTHVDKVVTMVYDANMCWGRFYCFVSGQTDTVQHVLLHGAVRLGTMEHENDSVLQDVNRKNHHQKGNSGNNREDPRKSLEMRYLV